jgi:Ran-binding protein 1
MSDEKVVVGSPEVVIGSPERDILVKPIVHLEKVNLNKNEDNEKELYKMRAKLYRYFVDEEDGSMWKERGIGDVRILKNTQTGTYRVLMRRDKTLKLCLNHYLYPKMEIKAHASNEKALLWSTPADFADGESKPETLCIRFGKPESAVEFKAKFEECVNSLSTENGDDDKLVNALSGLDVKE